LNHFIGLVDELSVLLMRSYRLVLQYDGLHRKIFLNRGVAYLA
jgi:hypothetical protein